MNDIYNKKNENTTDGMGEIGMELAEAVLSEVCQQLVQEHFW